MEIQHHKSVSSAEALNLELYNVTEDDYLKAKVTIFENIINLFAKFIRFISSRKISVFTKNAQHMTDKTHLRCSFNKNIQLYREAVTPENINIGTIQAVKNNGLTESETQQLAIDNFNAILENRNDSLTIKVPTYAPNQLEGKQTYDEYIKTYITTLDLCLRIAQKDTSIEQNKILKLIFNNANSISDNIALDKLNNEVSANISQHVKHSNTLIPKLLQERKVIAVSASDTEVNQPINLHHDATKISKKTDPRIQNLMKDLANMEEIEQHRQTINNNLNKLTDKQIVNERNIIDDEIKYNDETSLRSIKVKGGYIENPSASGLKATCIMNAANPECEGGAGVTGAIFGKSKKPSEITKIAQALIENTISLQSTDQSGNPIKNGSNFLLVKGQVVGTPSFGIEGAPFIVHALAPNITASEEYLKDRHDIIVAIIANSYENAMLYAAKQKKLGLCDSLALVLLGGNIYGCDLIDILTALKIAEKRLENNKDVQDLDICLITHKKIDDKQRNVLAKLRAIDNI